MSGQDNDRCPGSGGMSTDLDAATDVNEYLQRLQAAAGTMRDPQGDVKLLPIGTRRDLHAATDVNECLQRLRAAARHHEDPRDR
jgi:hypothetical protein